MSALNGLPKYVEVATALELQIRTGKWDGGRMPSVRGIAEVHKVSVVTASRALQILRDKGLIQTVERSGSRRVAPPSAERWALVLRLTPGPWQRATLSLSRIGFEAVARREPMHIEHDAIQLAVRMSESELRTSVRRAKDAGVNGVFCIPSRHSVEEMQLDERFLSACGAEGLPVVLVERNLRGYSRELTHDLVAVDDVDGSARLTRHLLELGRRRIAIVVASPTSSHNDKVAGYLYALHAATFDPELGVTPAPVVLYQSHDLSSREAYAHLADQVRERNLDGVVCFQDYTAMGLIFELLNRGIRVPDEVAVVGSDDLPMGDQFAIGITTYSYPSEGLAEQAIRLMRERRQNPDRRPLKVVVPGHLIVRESSVRATPSRSDGG
ncbi:HTH-type transcriptional regulator DegA [Gemmata sp. SH-PL17]|uniref:LacI family DNA-binding transcriptional regulator n=1 Tax=Gemmata sp. SH-PL17 TaxID=1630693 RepID=UPI0004B03A7F|nr:substrate-binding domain-containing protein [Gemmata sp. SH-PL17]AMV23369.1 HTH-type transcriptional regulator DegA [Gemmata sp. SH-PL17]